MEFDKQRFLCSLLEAPEEEPLLEPPEHSEYLQKQVFDKLAAGEAVDLKALDWNAFELRHVTPEDHGGRHERTHKDWLQGINYYLRKTPAASLPEKGFF